MSTLTSPPQSPGIATKEAAPQVQVFAHLEAAVRQRQEPAWVFPLRKAGIARFAELGFPTLRHEDWRFTNVAPVAALPFRPALSEPRQRPDPSALARRPFAQLPGDRLVFVNGHFAPALSRRDNHPAGVAVCPLSEAMRTQAAPLERHLGQLTRTATNAFTALNDAYFTDGGFIFVPSGLTVERPIQLVFVSMGENAGDTSHCRNLIVAEAGSRLTVIEHFLSAGEAGTVTNVATELVAAERATVEHVRFQDESAGAYHFGALHAELGRATSFVAHSFALGARLSRQSIHTVLDGEGLEAVLNGLYLTDGDRLADHHMIVDHAKPHCASHEYFNGILGARSRGVFHGRILVRKGAQKTDAKQTNKNILLSDDATANTKPQLEIYADDVKCTHGATVGQLNPESVFYLRSRGIPNETARRMLIHAFAGEIIDRVRCTDVREELDRLVWDRLEAEEHLQVGAHV